MPPLECKGTKTQRNLCQKPPIKRKNFIFYRKSWSIQKNDVPLHRNTGFSAVGSALRSGRRGRAFESPNPDCKQERLPKGSLSCLCLLAPGAAQNPSFLFSKDKLVGLGVIKAAFLLCGERRSCFIFLIFSFSPVLGAVAFWLFTYLLSL